MSSFNAEFRVEDGQARQSIKELKKGIKGLTEAFEEAEIGGKDFIEAASGLSGLQKELKDARSEIVNIDKAYGDLNKALDSVGEAYNKAERNAAEYHANLLKLAENQLKDQDRLRDKNFQAEVDDFDRRLKLASAAASKMSAQQRAIMEFRAGMGAKGAIPAIASPIRGTIEQGPLEASGGFPATAGSPAYREYITKAAKESQDALKEVAATANEIAPNPKAFLPGSLASYEAKLKRLKNEARLISPDTNRWQVLNKQILEAERGIAKINKRQSLGPTRGQRLGAAGGAFLYGGGMGGGFGSAAGGIAGGLMGGPAGAFTGAAIGQGIDTLAAGIGDMSKQAASLQQMQRGLAMASVDANDFAKAQEAVAQMSNKLLMPLDQATKHFTQLRANTREYNLSVDETREILEGTSLAIMATGGSAEDLDGAMRAVVQIMSKGGVQAEELRGQLGERFPGAVVKFAKANKMSFEELQAALEAGEVGIREFVTFAKENYEDYAKFSEQLATAPEYAGQRLAKAMQEISLEVGSLFGPMGAEIQDGFTNALQGITEFVRENRVVLGQMIKDFGEIIGPIAKVFVELLKIVGIFAFEVGKVFSFLFAQIKSAIGMASIGEAKVRLDKAKAATAGKTRPTPAREHSIVEIVKGQGVLSETKDLLGIKNEFEELDAAQRQFDNLGGMAAYKEASKPPGLSNLTYGGLGAGMSIDRTGKDEKEKNKKLQEFTNERIKTLQDRLEAEKLYIDSQLLLSDREKELQKAEKDFRYGNLIIDEQLAQAEKDSLKYRVEDRERFLAEMQTLADIERGAVKTKQQIAVAGPLMSEYQRLIDTQDELRLSLESVLSGQGELTESQKVATLISKVLKGATAEQAAGLDEFREKMKGAAGTVDELAAALLHATTIQGLQKQLDLAQTFDPKVRLRMEIAQGNKSLLPEQVEEQALFQEQINAASEYREKMEGIASSIGNSFGEAFKGIITGSMTAQEALAGMFRSIADHFADMVAQMIAEYLKMQAIGLLKTIFGAVAGGLGGGGANLGPNSSAVFGLNTPDMMQYSPLTAANGAVWGGGFTAFANGGMVTGPTMGLVGEGRYNEAIIPLPDGKSVPVQLSGGAGGNAAPINTSIVVNVKNGQAESQMSGSQGNQLARELEGAVRQVILKESRPGGLISSSR
jgi:tape measure domain-containing protein